MDCGASGLDSYARQVIQHYMIGELTIDYQSTIWSIGQYLESPAALDIGTRT